MGKNTAIKSVEKPASSVGADDDPHKAPPKNMQRVVHKSGPSRGPKGPAGEKQNSVSSGQLLNKPREKSMKGAGTQNGMEMLIGLEKAVRDVESVKELRLLIVNETRKFNGARQIFLVERSSGKRARFKVSAVSSLASVDRNSPLILSIEKVAERLARDVGISRQHSFSLSAYSEPEDNIDVYPFPEMLWIPLKTRKGEVFAGLLMARERVWLENEEMLSNRLAEIFSYAWQALTGPGRIEKHLKGSAYRTSLLLAGVMMLAGFLPVKLDVLAPAQIVAAKPFIVAAPVDGVIAQILVRPNSVVQKGDPLFRFVDTRLFNDYQLARRAVTVADARYKKAVRAAFSEPKARHDMALAKAELDLKMAERAYAKANYDKTLVRAPQAGLAIFHTAEEWTGKPVRTGEKVMTIADSRLTQVRIEVPVSDAIALKNGAPLKVFLDANPLRPLKGEVTYASYEAVKTPDNNLAYTVYGKFELPKKDASPRIGLRGTAQIYGEKVSLYFYLLRKPLAALRQMTGI